MKPNPGLIGPNISERASPQDPVHSLGEIRLLAGSFTENIQTLRRLMPAGDHSPYIVCETELVGHKRKWQKRVAFMRGNESGNRADSAIAAFSEKIEPAVHGFSKRNRNTFGIPTGPVA